MRRHVRLVHSDHRLRRDHLDVLVVYEGARQTRRARRWQLLI